MMNISIDEECSFVKKQTRNVWMFVDEWHISNNMTVEVYSCLSWLVS